MLKHLLTSQNVIGIALVIVVIALGNYFIFGSKASSPYAATEAESGVIALPATIQDDSSVSGGEFVQFNTVPGSNNEIPGLYQDGGTTANITSFAQATGEHATLMEEYSDGCATNCTTDQTGCTDGPTDPQGLCDNWQTISNSNWSWSGAGGSSGVRLVAGMVICPGTPTVPDGNLASGAAGNYNKYWKSFATNMVSEGFGNAIIRVGVEVGGSWKACHISNATDAANYASYYQQIVNTMRSVSGQSFQFAWELADTADSSFPGTYTAAEAYPGNSYVDYISTDTYDTNWNSSCGIPNNNTSTAPESQCNWDGADPNHNNILASLNTVLGFAQAHNKPMAFTEWGLSIQTNGSGTGLGDDPTFIDNMANWIKTKNVGFDIYFNSNSGGQENMITDGDFTKSLAEFSKDF